MMANIMGVRDPAALQRAIDLGIAFQLTNIARDVREDASVVGRLLDEADRYYDSANEGLRALSFRSEWAVAAAHGVYRDIGETVRRRGDKALDERVVVSKPRKLLGLGGGMFAALRSALPGLHMAYDPRLAHDHQAFEFSLQGVLAGDVVEWRIDDGETLSREGARYLWPLSRGVHSVSAVVSRNGRRIAHIDTTGFVVK